MPLILYGAIVTRPAPTSSAANGLDSARERLQYLGQLARDAYRIIRSDAEKTSSSSFQSVFLAPEHFFHQRLTAGHRYYAPEIKYAIVASLKKLSNECKNLLIVAGTVLSYRQLVTSKKDKATRVVQAIQEAMAKGQYTLSSGHAHSADEIGKKLASAVKSNDPSQLSPETKVGRNTAYICLNNKVCKYHKLSTASEVRGEVNTIFMPGLAAGGVFSVGGIRYGLEICAEHQPPSLLQTPVDIHLVISDSTTTRESKGKILLHAAEGSAMPFLKEAGVNVTTLGETFDSKRGQVFRFEVGNLQPTGVYELEAG